MDEHPGLQSKTRVWKEEGRGGRGREVKGKGKRGIGKREEEGGRGRRKGKGGRRKEKRRKKGEGKGRKGKRRKREESGGSQAGKQRATTEKYIESWYHDYKGRLFTNGNNREMSLLKLSRPFY